MKLLVHACCGPCSIMPTRLLQAAGHDIGVFYANSNIAPRAEYDRRLGELVRYARDHGFAVTEGAYDPQAWEDAVAPIGEALRAGGQLEAYLGARHVGGEDEPQDTAAEGAAAADSSQRTGAREPRSVAELLDDEHRRERCRACYRLRLEESAAYAAANGFEGLATTLAVSPYQFTDVIHEELDRAAAQAGVAAVFEDFRPYYDEATRISRELGMYRQNYCGCRFSVAEGEATRAFVKRQRAAAKAARAVERADEEAARASARAEKQAYADRQARKRAVLKQLREQKDSHADE